MKKLPNVLMQFTARNDYAFKKLFGTEENKDIMIEFLSLVTDLRKTDFDDVRIENNEQLPRFYNDKIGRLDIKIRLQDGRKIDVEMQNTYFDYYPKRSIFYCSKLIHEHFISGFQYSNLKKCIAINVLNSPFKLSRKVHSMYQIRESEEQTLLDELLVELFVALFAELSAGLLSDLLGTCSLPYLTGSLTFLKRKLYHHKYCKNYKEYPKHANLRQYVSHTSTI